MSTPFRRGSTWNLYVPCQGRLLQKSCGTSDGKLGRKMGRLVEELKEARRFDLLDAVGTGRITLGQLYDAHVDNALDALESRVRGARIADFIEPWLLAKRGSGLSAESVDLYRQRMQKLFTPPNAPAVEFVHELDEGRIIDLLAALDVTSGTRRQYLAELRSLCRYLVAKKALRTNPTANRDLIETPKKNRPRRRWVRADVDQHIVECADEPYRAALALAHGAGADRSDLLRVRVLDIDFSRGTVNLLGRKTEARHRFDVPIEPWAIPYLREVCTNRAPAELLFSGLTGDAISRAHERAVKAAGVDDYQLRDGRHSYAIRAILADKNLRDVSRWLGHSNLHTTYYTYVHFDGEVKRRLTGEA